LAPLKIEVRALVCGGRNYTDYDQVKFVLDQLLKGTTTVPGYELELVIIHGAAPGTDTMADTWAKEHNIRTMPFPADWSHYGPAAGAIRNKQMLDEGNPHVVIHFPGGRDTRNMASLAKKAGKYVVNGDKEAFNESDYKVSIEL
jgi:hypothetical protein